MVDEVEEALLANLLGQILARRHTHHRVQVCLHALLLLARLLLLLQLEGVAEVRRDVVRTHLAIDLGYLVLAHVDEHVRRRDLWVLPLRSVPRVLLVLQAAKLLLNRLALLDLGHALVVEAVPLLHAERAHKGVVVAAVGAAAVHEHRVESVNVAYRLVGLVGKILVSLAVHVEGGGELEALVDLGHGVGVEVVLKASQVQLENGRQVLEEHPLFGILLPEAVGVVLVLAVEHLLLDVLIEARVQVLAPLDRHLQVVVPEIRGVQQVGEGHAKREGRERGGAVGRARTPRREATCRRR